MNIHFSRRFCIAQKATASSPLRGRRLPPSQAFSHPRRSKPLGGRRHSRNYRAVPWLVASCVALGPPVALPPAGTPVALPCEGVPTGGVLGVAFGWFVAG